MSPPSVTPTVTRPASAAAAIPVHEPLWHAPVGTLSFAHPDTGYANVGVLLFVRLGGDCANVTPVRPSRSAPRDIPTAEQGRSPFPPPPERLRLQTPHLDDERSLLFTLAQFRSSNSVGLPLGRKGSLLLGRDLLGFLLSLSLQFLRALIEEPARCILRVRAQSGVLYWAGGKGSRR
jgi:hypothetical protein